MKKLMAILLSVFMVFSLGACGGGGNAVDEKPMAEAAAKSFLDAFCALDIKTAATYVTDPAYLGELSTFDMRSFKDNMINGLPAEYADFKDEYAAFADGLFGKILDCCSYTLHSVEPVEGGYAATATITFPEDIDGAALDTVFTEESVNAIFMELYTAGKINDNMTEAEMTNIIFPALFNRALENVTVKAETMTDFVLIMTKSGDKWLVDTSKTKPIK